AVKDEDRLLGDLHLNSITVSQLVIETARQLGLPPPVSPSDYSTARIVDVAHALEELARTGGSSRRNSTSPSGVDYWTRCFQIELVERAGRGQSRLLGESDWKVLSFPDHPLRDDLKRSFDALPGCGVVVALPSEVDERVIELLLDGAREVFA